MKQYLLAIHPCIRIVGLCKFEALTDEIINNRQMIELCFRKARKYHRKEYWLPAFNSFSHHVILHQHLPCELTRGHISYSIDLKIA